ncbi:MAG: iron uptake porin [Alkalinema sp. RL_2_19]|nr:iron uptake porin [Alkalinema sp. RL_2_19]
MKGGFGPIRQWSWWGQTIGISLGIAGSIGVIAPTQAQTIFSAPAMAPPSSQSSTADSLMQSIPNVHTLSDVQPNDWAYKYVKILNERYNLLIGDLDGKFRGNEPLTRYEFAAVLAQVLKRVEIFRDQEQEELNALQRLLNSYRDALTDLRIRVQGFPAQADQVALAGLEERVDRLVRQNVSPTTKLQTQIVQTASNGTGAALTALSRVRLNLKSSFTGRDQLITQLEFGNNGQDAIAKAQGQRGNALGTNGRLVDGGGLIEIGVPAPGRIRKLYYEFPLAETVRLAVGSQIPPSDFVDRNRFANHSGSNFASSFFANNPLIIQNRIDQFGGAGVAADWQITPQISLRGVYAASNANQPTISPSCPINAACVAIFIPPPPPGGLFGQPYQATLETEYRPSPNLAVRLQYTNAAVPVGQTTPFGGNGFATIDDARINAIGLNAEWAVQREIALFGRFGLGQYRLSNRQGLGNFDDLNPRSWMLGATFGNFLITGSKVGVAIGQPFIESGFGNATQTNAEGYFSFLINDKINLIPSLQIVSNPDNQKGRAIWQWAFRVVVDF